MHGDQDRGRGTRGTETMGRGRYFLWSHYANNKVRGRLFKMAGLELSSWLPLLGVPGFVRDLVLTLLAVLVVAVVVREGPAGLARRLLGAAKLLPGVEWMIAAVLRREVCGFVRQVQEGERSRSDHKGGKTLAIPQKGQ